jgi:hypothetical protein
MRRRFGFVVMLLGMLGMRTTGAQLVQPAAVRDLTARHAVWPPLNDATCLACFARGRGRQGASPDTAAWSAVTDDSTGHRHPVAGLIVGAAAGVLIAYVHDQNDARKCQGPSCEAGPPEFVFTGPLFGFAGAVIGGFIGWLFRTE